MIHMMFYLLFILLCIQHVSYALDVTEIKRLDKLAFGSCNKHDKPNHLWDDIVATEADLWLWLGIHE